RCYQPRGCWMMHGMASRTDDAADRGQAPGAAPGRHALIRTTLPVDLRLTLGPLRRMGGLSWRTGADGSWWRAARTPEGPVTASITATREGILVWAWGPGAGWALETAPDLLGARDSLDGFDPARGLVRDLHRTMPGLRIT